MIARSAAIEMSLRLAVLSAKVANFCDHAEHNEAVHLEDVRASARALRDLASEVAETSGLDIVELYADRLRAIEERNVLHDPSKFDGKDLALTSVSWRDLQLVQAEHDRLYHPDVVGLMKSEQVRHYALHLAKLAGAAAELVADPLTFHDFSCRRLPDMFLFGIKLSTVTGEKLSRDKILTKRGLGPVVRAA